MFALSGKSRDVMCSLGDLMYMRTCVLVLIYRAHFVGITAAFRPGLDCKKVCVCVCMCVCVCVPTFVFSSSHLLISVDDACARLAIPNQQHSVDERDARLARTYRGCGKCAPNANVMRLTIECSLLCINVCLETACTLPLHEYAVLVLSHRLQHQVRPFFADMGGPIILAQIENELNGAPQEYVDWCGQVRVYS